MPKFSGRSLSGSRKSTGTVTVLEARVHRSSERNAKLAFWLTLFVVGLLSATILADKIHPILAMFVGAALGAISAAFVYVLVRVWPVIRLLWWWTPEIVLSLTGVYGFTALAHHTNLYTRLLVVVGVVGVPAAVPWTRKRIVALAWCLIVRHRIRTCFRQFIISNQSGSLPLILWARPTPVGERVWVWLRPGLSLSDLEARLDKIAVACWASTVIVDRASDGNAAYVRLDVKRRDALTATVANPLVGLVDRDTPASERETATVPTALDLPDVAEPAPATPAGSTARIESGTRKPAAAPAAQAAARVVAGAGGEDLSEWV